MTDQLNVILYYYNINSDYTSQSERDLIINWVWKERGFALAWSIGHKFGVLIDLIYLDNRPGGSLLWKDRILGPGKILTVGGPNEQKLNNIWQQFLREHLEVCNRVNKLVSFIDTTMCAGRITYINQQLNCFVFRGPEFVDKLDACFCDILHIYSGGNHDEYCPLA